MDSLELSKEPAYPKASVLLAQLSQSMRTVSLQLETVTAELHSLGVGDRPLADKPDAELSAPAMPSERQLQLIALIDRLDETRCQMLAGQVQSDPAWNMLMELTKSKLLGFKVSITSLCLASKAPVTTALRKLEKLIADDLVVRVADASDRRRSYVEISPECEALVLSVLGVLESMMTRSPVVSQR